MEIYITLCAMALGFICSNIQISAICSSSNGYFVRYIYAIIRLGAVIGFVIAAAIYFGYFKRHEIKAFNGYEAIPS
jgi:hypothetical protein